MEACLAKGEYMGEIVTRRSYGGCSLTEALYGRNTVLPKHIHGAATICIVLHGGFLERSGRQTTRAEAGMVLYRPAGHSHSDEFVASGRTLGIDLPPTDDVPGQPRVMQSPSLSTLSAQIYREIRRRDGCAPLAIESLLYTLQAEISDTTAREDLRPPLWVRSARDRLLDQYLSPPSAREIACEVGVHPVHLSREFHRFYGCSLGQHVRYIRVQRARQALAQSDASLGEIALDAGFCDQAHFSRTFVEFTGMTPGEYRRRARAV